jgi:hypothetical protein
MWRRISRRCELRSWPACSRDGDNFADKEGHMMDSVPFFFFTLAHEEQLFLDALRIRLRNRIDLAKVRGIHCLCQLVFLRKFDITPIAHRRRLCHARTNPASRIAAARPAAYRCSTTSALPNHCALGWTFSVIHSLAAAVSGVKRKTVPSLRTRTSGRTLPTMSLVAPNQSLLLEPICVLPGIGTHQDGRLKHKTCLSQAGKIGAGEIACFGGWVLVLPSSAHPSVCSSKATWVLQPRLPDSGVWAESFLMLEEGYAMERGVQSHARNSRMLLLDSGSHAPIRTSVRCSSLLGVEATPD